MEKLLVMLVAAFFGMATKYAEGLSAIKLILLSAFNPKAALGGVKSIMPYKIIFIALVAIGPYLSLTLILWIADIVNRLIWPYQI